MGSNISELEYNINLLVDNGTPIQLIDLIQKCTNRTYIIDQVDNELLARLFFSFKQHLIKNNQVLQLKGVGGHIQCLKCQKQPNENLLVLKQCGCYWCKACLRNKIYEDTNGSLQQLKVLCVCQAAIDQASIEEAFGGKNQLQAAQEKAEIESLKQLLNPEEFQKQNSHYQCLICMEYQAVSGSITLDCDHRFCKRCMSDHIINLVNSSQVSEEHMKCPIQHCQVVINPEMVRYCSDEQILLKYLDKKLRSMKITDGLMKYCPAPDCYGGLFIAFNEWKFNCPACKYICCPQCNEKPHKGQSCQQYKEKMMNNKKLQDDIEFEKYLKNKKLVKCPQCGAISEKESGCNFLTCSSLQCQSKTHFCSLCNKLLEKKQHFSHYKTRGPFGRTCNTIDKIKEQ